VTDDDEIAMARIQYRVVISLAAPDHPEFRADTVFQRKRCKRTVNGKGFLFLGYPKSGDDAVDCLPAARKGIRRMLCGIAEYAVDPDQVRSAAVGELGGTFTDLLAFRGIIEKDGNAFPTRQHLFHRRMN
jgi:hypothetical protein